MVEPRTRETNRYFGGSKEATDENLLYFAGK